MFLGSVGRVLQWAEFRIWRMGHLAADHAHNLGNWSRSEELAADHAHNLGPCWWLPALS